MVQPLRDGPLTLRYTEVRAPGVGPWIWANVHELPDKTPGSLGLGQLGWMCVSRPILVTIGISRGLEIPLLSTIVPRR